MKILVLFDGAGLARLGLEQAGHECLGVELDPAKHHLSKQVGSGRCVLADAQDFYEAQDRGFDALWASPPCVRRTSCIKDLTKANGLRDEVHQGDYLAWSLQIAKQFRVSWVENVTIQGGTGNEWGQLFNAAQFLADPLQNRNRVIGGSYANPQLFYPYKRWFPGICPTITATEYKASGATDKCRASRFYRRNLTLAECAHHQGFAIPQGWYRTPDHFMPGYRHRDTRWIRNLYEAIGNGVPVYMAKAFGQVYGTHST